METRSRRRRDSDADSVASASSEPAITRSRSTTPFTLRSQCKRHGSECPEGHGIHFTNRLSPSPRQSCKKSPKKIVIERNGSVRKNLVHSLEARYQKDKQEIPNASTVSPTKNVAHTSDYSSAEEEAGGNNTNHFSTPLNTSLKTSPIQRSAEKTDYTYAKSYSYRTEVTPDRVTCMPNMSRRSIESSSERCHGEGFSSPELKLASYQSPFGKAPGLNISYRNGHDTERDLDETYQVKTLSTSNSYVSKASIYTSFAYSKLRGLMFNIAWWIYLITCYSLLLDTSVLQSRGIAKLRNFCKQQTKSTRNFVMLFLFFLPLCLFTGGLLYSALHAFNSRAADIPANKITNPSLPKDISPPASSAFSPFPDSVHRVDDSAWQDIQNKLKQTKETLLELQQRIINNEGKMSNMATQVGSFQGQMIAAHAQSNSCCDQAAPDVLERLVDAKLQSLLAMISRQTGLNIDNVGKTVSLLNGALVELQELKDWKQKLEKRDEKTEQEISQLRHDVDEMDTLKQTVDSIDKSIKKWESESKLAMIESLKEHLVAEIRSQMKTINAKSGQGLTKDEVEQLIHSALGLYDSDKTGLADYALEPAGGVVLSTRCTETFSSHRPRLSIWGFSLWSEPNNPRVVIQPGIIPGQCWSFRGFDGYLVIQLSRRIVPTAFTLEHIPRSLAPDGHIDSAPRNFTGLTREVDVAGNMLGEYTYNSVGAPLQTFPVQLHDPGAYSIIELRIHSNHGNLNYTCLYRFRVHGQVA